VQILEKTGVTAFTCVYVLVYDDAYKY